MIVKNHDDGIFAKLCSSERYAHCSCQDDQGKLPWSEFALTLNNNRSSLQRITPAQQLPPSASIRAWETVPPSAPRIRRESAKQRNALDLQRQQRNRQAVDVYAGQFT
ncbi:hypothetical protein HF086_008410, partial [Spodoptera exigua]